MTAMISEVYAAFRKAGVQEEDARMVAEALSAESLAKKDDVRKLDKELLIIKLMLGLIIAIQVMLILRTLLM
ncbi:MAG: integrase [Cocleimonas sp.]